MVADEDVVTMKQRKALRNGLRTHHHLAILMKTRDSLQSLHRRCAFDDRCLSTLITHCEPSRPIEQVSNKRVTTCLADDYGRVGACTMRFDCRDSDLTSDATWQVWGSEWSSELIGIFTMGIFPLSTDHQQRIRMMIHDVG